MKNLLELGASLDVRCRWTQMTPLHYAAFFDVGPIVTTLLMVSKVRKGLFISYLTQLREIGEIGGGPWCNASA